MSLVYVDDTTNNIGIVWSVVGASLDYQAARRREEVGGQVSRGRRGRTMRARYNDHRFHDGSRAQVLRTNCERRHCSLHHLRFDHL